MNTSRIFFGFKNHYQDQLFSAVMAGFDQQPGKVDQILKFNFELPINPQLVMVDLGYFQDRQLSVAGFTARLLARYPDCRLVLQNSSAWMLSATEKAWAKALGVQHFVPRFHGRRADRTLLGFARQLGTELGLEFSEAKAKTFLSILKVSDRFISEPTKEKAELALLEKLDNQSLQLEHIAQMITKPSGFLVKDRTWRFKKYPQVFQGDEACLWLQTGLKLSEQEALTLGELIHRTRSFEHVSREHEFKNAMLFYRFIDVEPACAIVRKSNVSNMLTNLAGLEIKNRNYLNSEFADCFIGSEAVTWLEWKFTCSRDDAIQLGQLLFDLGFIEHVTREHEFKDSGNFYRFNGIGNKKSALVTL